MLSETPTRTPSEQATEALIREARQRQLRRRLLGAALVALAAGAVLTLHALVASGRELSTRSPEAIGAGLSSCRMSNLAVKEIGISSPTGLDRRGLQFTNLSGSSCRLDGYPVLQFSDGKGIIPFRFRELGKARPVTVPGHGSMFSIFSKYRCDYGWARVARETTIGLPGATQGSTSLPQDLGPGTCKPGIPTEGRWVTLTPFESLRAAYRVSLIGGGFGRLRRRS